MYVNTKTEIAILPSVNRTFELSVFMHFTNIYVTIADRKLTWWDKEEVSYFDILKMFTIWRSVVFSLSWSEHELNCFKLLTKLLTCIYISIAEEKKWKYLPPFSNNSMVMFLVKFKKAVVWETLSWGFKLIICMVGADLKGSHL